MYIQTYAYVRTHISIYLHTKSGQRTNTDDSVGVVSKHKLMIWVQLRIRTERHWKVCCKMFPPPPTSYLFMQIQTCKYIYANM